MSIPTVTLNNGAKLPLLGLGTSTRESSDDRTQVRDAVYDAISLGYRHIDTAWLYLVEDQVGEGVRAAIKDGLVKREDMFIVTKVWVWNLSYDNVLKQAKESLDTLGLDYIDALLIHWPVPMKNFRSDRDGEPFPLDENGKPAYDDSVDIHKDTWPAMEECVKRGYTKSIGVSNYSIEQIEDLMKVAKIKPVVNQVESTPFLAQNKLKAVCEKYGIVITAYSPLGQSALKQSDGSWAPHPVRTKLFSNEVIKSLSEKYSKTVGQILLKFHTDRGVPVIPKSVNKGRMAENMNIFDFSFDESDWKALETLNIGLRSIGDSSGHDVLSGSRYYPLKDDGK